MEGNSIKLFKNKCNLAQMRWHKIIKPKASMLKFRLSWKPGKTNYLEGDIYFPIWGPITTTESRLIVKRDANITEYDNRKYEQQMFYFNTGINKLVFKFLLWIVMRVARYFHDVEGEGIDHCYDCTAEVILNILLKLLFF